MCLRCAAELSVAREEEALRAARSAPAGTRWLRLTCTLENRSEDGPQARVERFRAVDRRFMRDRSVIRALGNLWLAAPDIALTRDWGLHLHLDFLVGVLPGTDAGAVLDALRQGWLRAACLEDVHAVAVAQRGAVVEDRAHLHNAARYLGQLPAATPAAERGSWASLVAASRRSPRLRTLAEEIARALGHTRWYRPSRAFAALAARSSIPAGEPAPAGDPGEPHAVQEAMTAGHPGDEVAQDARSVPQARSTLPLWLPHPLDADRMLRWTLPGDPWFWLPAPAAARFAATPEGRALERMLRPGIIADRALQAGVVRALRAVPETQVWTPDGWRPVGEVARALDAAAGRLAAGLRSLASDIRHGRIPSVVEIPEDTALEDDGRVRRGRRLVRDAREGLAIRAERRWWSDLHQRLVGCGMRADRLRFGHLCAQMARRLGCGSAAAGTAALSADLERTLDERRAWAERAWDQGVGLEERRCR